MEKLESQYLENRQINESLDNREWLKQLVNEPDEIQKDKPTVEKQELTKQSFLGGMLKTYKDNFSNTLDVIKGTGELGLTAITGAVAFPIAKAGGLMTMPFWGGEEAQNFENYISNLYTYQPPSKVGQQSAEKLGKIMEIPFIPSKWLGGIAGKITGSPDVKYGVTAVGEVATMLLIPKAVEGVKKVTGITPKTKPPITTAELAEWDKKIQPEKKQPVKGEQLEKARGDLTAEMEKINERASVEVEKALNEIPKEEWDKWYKEEKPKNIEDISKLIEERAKRLIAEEEKLGPDYKKLPQEYKDAIVREADRLKERAENLKQIAKEADQAGTELIIVPEVFKPKAEVAPIEGKLRPMGEIAQDLKKIIDLDERGSISGQPLSKENVQAYYRLQKDFNAIAQNAKRVGKTIEQYLTDLGVDPEVIRYMGQKIQETEKGKTEATVPMVEPSDIRINLDRITNTESVKNIIADINLKQQESGVIEKTTRGVRTHEETIAASKTKKGGVTPEEILTRKPGETWNAEQQTAVRDFANSAVTKVKELTDKSLAGDMKAANELPAALVLFERFHSQDVGVGAEIARALEARKIMSEPGRQPFNPNELADLAQAVKDSVGDPVLLAKRIKALETPVELKTFTRQFIDGLKKGQNIFTFAWINGLLSGPPTHGVNFATNSSMFLGGIETRRIAGRVGQAREFLGGKPGVQVGEANSMVYGAIEGFMDALKVSKESWKQNETQFGHGKIENYQKNPLSREALGLTDSYGHSIEFLSNLIEKTGEVIGSPGRGLMVADEFWKALNYRAELGARAFREAKLEGLSGDAFGKRVKFITDHPEQFEAINSAARLYAEKQTFTEELGLIGKSIQNISNATVFTKIIAPFIRTPGNILKVTQDYTPILNMASKRFWEDINTGGAAADIALSKMSMGVMMTAVAAYLTKSGIITGNGPSDPKLRKIWLEDHQPNSVKIGDTQVSFDRMDFPGNTFAIIADTVTMMDDNDLDTPTQYLTAVALATAEVMINKNYLQGLSDALKAIREPDKGAADWFKQWSRSLTPNIVRTGNRAFFDDVLREVNSVGDALRAGTPGLSEYLPPKRGFWGQPIFPHFLGPDLLSPYATKVDKHDPVNEEIIANGIPLSMPLKSLGGYKPSENVLKENQPRATWGIKLSPEEYDRYVILSRNEKIIGNKSLHERLDELIKTPTYERQSTGPDGGRALLIRTWVNQYETVAEQKLYKEFPDLQKRVIEQKTERAQALRPGQ